MSPRAALDWGPWRRGHQQNKHHLSLSLSLYINIYMYIYMYLYTYIHIHIYIYIYICIYLDLSVCIWVHAFQSLPEPVTPSSHSKNSLSKICSKGWVAQKPFLIGNLTAALRLSEGWVRKDPNLGLRTGCSSALAVAKHAGADENAKGCRLACAVLLLIIIIITIMIMIINIIIRILIYYAALRYAVLYYATLEYNIRYNSCSALLGSPRLPRPLRVA